MGTLYTNTKIFHFKEKLDSIVKATDSILAPIHVRIKPTNICGHNCCYCAYRADNLQLGRDMVERNFIPEKKMMEIVDDIVSMKVKAVTFSGGGDPFCYPYLLKTIKKLSKTRVRFAALTNGSRLEGDLAETFAYYGTWLRISLDGWNDESYSSYRKVPKGEFTKLIHNINNFKKLKGKCYLGISLIVDKNNALRVYEVIKLAKNMGVDSIKVSPCLVDDEGAKNNAYHGPIFNEVKDQIGKAISDLMDDAFEISDSYCHLDEKYKKEYTWCPYLQIMPVIGADLNIYSCQDKAYNLAKGSFGSIKNFRFKEFWFSDKGKFFKINPAAHCNHHCVSNAKNKIIMEYLNASKEHLDFV